MSELESAITAKCYITLYHDFMVVVVRHNLFKTLYNMWMAY